MKLKTLVSGLGLAALGLWGLHATGHLPLPASFAARPEASGTVDQISRSDNGQPAHQAVAPAVTVAKAVPITFIETVYVTGSLIAREEILVAPEIEGHRIEEVRAEVGDHVRAGDILARLSKDTLNSQLDENTAAIARANAAIAQAENQITDTNANEKQSKAALKRAKPLRKSGHLSHSVFDERQAAATSAAARTRAAHDGLALARAERLQLEARRRELQWRLERADVRAPTDGLVFARSARIGALASATGQPLFKIVQDSEIELAAEVPETNLPKIKVGQAVTLTVTGTGEFKGTVRLVEPQIDAAKRQGHVRVFLGVNPALNIGSFATGTIATSTGQGLSVPASAVLYDASKKSILRVVDGRVQAITVTTGMSSSDRVQILTGLKDGDMVVAKAGTFLRDGERITPVLPAAKLSEAR